ncbi:MAG: hypothetical protein NVS1B2_24430 [Vulcanimicrobiaceae bacterium]
MPLVALCIACAVGVELVMELGGFDPEGHALSVRHIVLGIVGMVASAAFVIYLAGVWHAASGRRDFKRRLRLELAAFSRDGRQSVVTTVGLTFVCAVLAQLGQHDLAKPGDVASWLVASVVSAILLSLIVRAVMRRLPDVVVALLALFETPFAAPTVVRRTRHVALAWSIGDGALSTLGSRPPPLVSR